MLCPVPCFLCCVQIFLMLLHMTYELGIRTETTSTRNATHPPAVPMVEGDAEGGGGGDLANGPLAG